MNTLSILSWCFFFVAVVSALILTTSSAPIVRRYRSLLLSLVTSGILLGTACALGPFAMQKWNPDQSRLLSLDQLPITEWLEPIHNPNIEPVPANSEWLRNTPYEFQYELSFEFSARRILASFANHLVLVDQSGDLRGFNAYSGLNHWRIPLQSEGVIDIVKVQDRYYLLDLADSNTLRVSSFDFQNPATLWQRFIPSSRQGRIQFDFDSQAIVVSAGETGVWALKAKTGEILWKHPEVYTKTLSIISPQEVLVFEPKVAQKEGRWIRFHSMTGAVTSKTLHQLPEIQRIWIHSGSLKPTQKFLAQFSSQEFRYFDRASLEERWIFQTAAPVNHIEILDAKRFFVLYDSNLLELRTLSSNRLIWQKKLTEIDPRWVRPDVHHNHFALLNLSPQDRVGASFYSLDTAGYQFTASASESMIDLRFFGDWVYLLGEKTLTAYRIVQKNQ